MDSKEIMIKILDEVKESCGEQPRPDDITPMAIKVDSL